MTKLPILTVNKIVTIDEMREQLFELEWEQLRDKDLRMILRDGCVGWDNIDADEIFERWTEIWGDE